MNVKSKNVPRTVFGELALRMLRRRHYGGVQEGAWRIRLHQHLGRGHAYGK